jgi:hypothetical protein
MPESTDATRIAEPCVSSRATVEIVRRLALVLAIVTGIALTCWTRFEPYVMVSLATSEQIARAQGAPEPGIRAPNALLPTRASRPSDGTLATVSGPAWETAFAGIAQSFTQNYPIPGWEHRVQDRDLKQARKDNERRGRMTAADRTEEADRVARLQKQYGMDVTFRGSFRTLYFLASEAPFGAIASPERRRTLLLQLAGRPDVTLEAAFLPAYKLHGFSDVITLPQAFAYPYRHLGPWAALAGLVIYLLLPWGAVPANVLAYRRWRVMLGDLASGVLLFGMFFVLPFFVIGGTREAVTSFLPFTLVFWLFAAGGLVALYWAAWCAAYRLAVLPQGIEIAGLAGHMRFGYDDIKQVQPLRMRPPRWLIVLSWVAVLLGRSPGQTAGQAGRALLLSSSAADGLRIDLKSGKKAFVWYSDQMGSKAVPHFETLGKALRRPGIAWADSTAEIRAIFPPTR